jgi:hypothetical protein
MQADIRDQNPPRNRVHATQFPSRLEGACVCGRAEGAKFGTQKKSQTLRVQRLGDEVHGGWANLRRAIEICSIGELSYPQLEQCADAQANHR